MNGVTGLLVFCALVVTALLLRRELSPQRVRVAMPVPSVVEDWQTYATSGHTLGNQDARVTIVEFADFECPYCRQLHLFVDSLRLLGKDFKVIYRHFPVQGHKFALAAARASECAADQGRFAELHSWLYSHPDSIGVAPWTWFASNAGVADSAKFSQCIRSNAAVEALARDTIAARRLGVTGTPTILIGKLLIAGLVPLDSLAAYIDRAGPQS
ncbi:MAG: thioredoxin domain-containing protein [Gemmatimonadaceae bacterium]